MSKEDGTKPNPLMAALYGVIEDDTTPELGSDLPEDGGVVATGGGDDEVMPASISLADFATSLDDSGLSKRNGTPVGESQPSETGDAEGGGASRKSGLKYKKREEPVALPVFETKPDAGESAQSVLNEEDSFEKELLPEEREQLDMAKFASQNIPEFKGLDKQFQQFFKKHREFVDKQLAEDPDVEFNQYNDDYQKFLRVNRPNLTAMQMNKINLAIVEDSVSRKYGQKFKELEETHKKKLEELDVKPKVEQELAKFDGELYSVVPETLRKVLDEQGEQEARKQFPLEFEISDKVLGNTYALGQELLKVNKRLTPYSPSTNPTHKYLGDFIESQGQLFHQQGGNLRIRDGKQFLPASSYAQAISAGQAHNYWTFKDTDVLEMLKFEAKKQINNGVKREHDRIASAGYERKGAAVRPSTPPPTLPSGNSRPAPRSSPKSPTVDVNPTQGGNSFLGVLGY